MRLGVFYVSPPRISPVYFGGEVAGHCMDFSISVLVLDDGQSGSIPGPKS